MAGPSSVPLLPLLSPSFLRLMLSSRAASNNQTIDARHTGHVDYVVPPFNATTHVGPPRCPLDTRTCYNFDGTQMTCCSSACAADNDPIATCHVADAPAPKLAGKVAVPLAATCPPSAPNPCYNFNGQSMACCPGGCGPNGGSLATCSGDADVTSAPTGSPSPSVSSPSPTSPSPIASSSPTVTPRPAASSSPTSTPSPPVTSSPTVTPSPPVASPPTGSSGPCPAQAPNPCYNHDGQSMACCPGACGPNAGSLATCEGVAAALAQPISATSAPTVPPATPSLTAATLSPTNAPATPSPTSPPATPSPTNPPATPAPTNPPPTKTPAPPSPTNAPTPSPTSPPAAPSPTTAPGPTTAFATPSPTKTPPPQAPSPTTPPITPSPTNAPTTASPTQTPAAPSPTSPPATPSPTTAPTTPAPITAAVAPSGTNLPCAPSGYRWVVNPSLTDEFNGNGLDASKWRATHPYWAGRLPSQFDPDNVAVGGGVARLTSTTSVSSIDQVNDPYNDPWVSAAVISSNAAIAGYGYYECRFKASNMQMTSAFWLQSQRTEIDVIEAVGLASNYRSRNMNINSHYYPDNVSPSKPDFASPYTYRLPAGTLTSGDFHTYGVWFKDASTLLFYFDGQMVWQTTPPGPFTEQMYLFLDTEVFSLEGLPTVADLKDPNKNAFVIDYVRAFVLQSA